MKHWNYVVVAVMALTVVALGHGNALEIRVHPGEFVYLYEEAPERNLYTVVVQQIAIHNTGPRPVNIESLELRALREDKEIAATTVDPGDLDASAAKIAALSQQGVLKLYDFHFQTSRYLPEDVKFASSRKLQPGEALLIFARAMLVSGNTDQIAIVARGSDEDGKSIEANISLKAEKHRSSVEYSFPVSGIWYVGAAPSLHSHHRWVANQEFALDLGILGPGSRTHSGMGSKLSEYFDYGKDVMAVADGEVIAASNDAIEADGNLRQPGESSEAYDQRTMASQQELLSKSYLAPLGNYIVIRHENNEYSHYAHLKTGSVRVKKGDHVKKGQVIGQLGHSGNSTEPHLHFQITDGADPMYSRGIPVVFSNVEVEMLGYKGRPLQTGWIVSTSEPSH